MPCSYTLLGLFISIAKYVLSSLRIGSRRTKFKISHGHVACLHVAYLNAGSLLLCSCCQNSVGLLLAQFLFVLRSVMREGEE